MRLRVWNAFASNNSGSYTIVGRFPDEGAAHAVADELAAVVAAHAQWLAAHGHDRWTTQELSPLERFAHAQGLTNSRGSGRDDDWPEHDAPPRVQAHGTQVVLFVDCTVTMPPLLGELMYRRGGRVDVELDHTHDPLVWIHEVWWPWQGRDEAAVKAARVRLLDGLFAEGGPVRTQGMIATPPSWTDHGATFGHADLSLAAVWREPMAAIEQVRALVSTVGAKTRLRVMEATSPTDPAGVFRPCWPWPTEALSDVVVEALGAAPKGVLEAIAEVVLASRSGYPGSKDAAAHLVARLPATVAWALPPAAAQACAQALEQAGATVGLVDHEYPDRIVASPLE
jgi:hypothetical protein